MKTGTLIGYFSKVDEARAAFWELQKKGYSRVVGISKDADGKIQSWDPFRKRRRYLAVMAFILFAALASFYSIYLSGMKLFSDRWDADLILIVLSGFMGVLISLLGYRRSKFGIEHIRIENHSRLLVFGETVLLIQTPIERMQFPMTILMQNGEVPPAVFIFHPTPENPGEEDWSLKTLLSPIQIKDHALSLARDLQLSKTPLRNFRLLKRIENSRKLVHRVCLNLSEAIRMGHGTPPTAEWLLDNEYIFESNVRDVKLNLPRNYYRQLPALVNEPYQGLPRIYSLARELASGTDLRFDQENISAFLETYQSVASLSIGEIWAVPQMLRLVLIESIKHIAVRSLNELHESETADFWANRLITVSRQEPNLFFSFLAELSKKIENPSPYFVSQLIDYLYDEEAVLIPIQSWLERTLGKSLNDLGVNEKNRQMKDQISIGNAFSSLRQLGLLDWKVCFEKLSAVERILRSDPAGIYPQMDFDTRDRYRRAVEDLSRGSGLTEEQVARYAIESAAQAAADFPADLRRFHVGIWLIGEERGKLAQDIGCRESWRFRALHWVYRHHTAFYLLGIGALSSGIISFVARGILQGQGSVMFQFLFALLLLIPISQLVIEGINSLVTQFFPARVLPKMNFRMSGIPDAYRTLVVVPMMLIEPALIEEEVEKLEIRYIANKEENILFSLFSDYQDSADIHNESDKLLLQTAIQSIEALNQRYGGERFFLFHRERKWSDSEQNFIGWERKRGKLEELNDLINGNRSSASERLVYVGDANQLFNVRFIITLDSDTQLPHDAARRMIETLSHPLNQPRFDSAGRILPGSYTIIQPRVTSSLPSMSRSLFSRLFSNPVGIDPYTNAVSDVYQDLTGEGSFYGKGIYDVRAFGRILSGKLPDSRILSHDLIEGAHVRVGLTSDIELYDEFPQDYVTYSKRQHRWIRGDWQIMDWLMPRVPQADGYRHSNPLSWFDRWKIFDNLRRSLLPAASLTLLLFSWLISVQTGWIATLVVAAQLFFHSLVKPVTLAASLQSLGKISLINAAHDLLRVMVEVALLPYQTWLTLDAMGRVFYRRYISKRHLLEWNSVQMKHNLTLSKTRQFVLSMSLISIFSVTVGFLVLHRMPANLMITIPWLSLWFLSPIAGWLLNWRPQAKPPKNRLLPADRQFLRNIARRTWRYFQDFVNEASCWLPPDNYQVSYQNQLAMRTSPTNIGLWLVSALSAHDFGYLSVDEVVRRLTRTMETITKLERYEGHLFNWYDIQTLAPLKPHYISTVDSGNLLGALWTLDQGLRALIQKPLLEVKIFAGLHDTREILRQNMSKNKFPDWIAGFLTAGQSVWKTPSNRVVDIIESLRSLQSKANNFAETADTNAAVVPGANWIEQLQIQLNEWSGVADRYLSWIIILAEKTEEEINELNANMLSVYRHSLQQAPSLQDLATGNIPSIQLLQQIRDKNTINDSSFKDWLERVLEAFNKSKWLAGEMLALAEQLIWAGNELSQSMNMNFLYNSDLRLFSIGYNVSEGRLDHSFYDLLTSEARLGSFVAIARGDISFEHWFAMTRPYGTVERRRVLLSWTGTMFEYLMPLIFQRSYKKSLLDKASRDAVTVQIAYGRKLRLPWGISESAFGDLDFHKTYQYKAFGVPALGLKRGLADRIVLAPYASLLAIKIAPKETVRNLKKLVKLGLLKDYGFYEAVDFGRYASHESGSGMIVATYMAHHHAMSFLALTNFMHNDSIQQYFHADPRVRAFEPLLHERIPHLPPLHHISTREKVSLAASSIEVVSAVSQFETPHTGNPKTQLLFNGHYGLMLTNAGGGYSRWNNYDITRWRSDRTLDRWGTFCYIHDLDSDRLWCNSYQPVAEKVEDFSVNFSLDRALFRRVDDGIVSETEIIVSAEDDVEIRRLTLINRSSLPRRLDLTSYSELVLALHNADRQHQSFNKLFIQTEAVPEQQALIAFRRARDENDPIIYVAHRLTLEPANDETLRFETDRRCFIGRGHSMADPMGARQEPGNSQGFVLDPILSLRRSLNLNPGQRVQVSLIMAAGETREQVLNLMSKYGDPRSIDRAMDLVWSSAQTELRLLHIQPDEARRFQQLAGHLLYSNPRLRAPVKTITENRKGQSGLWAYGISGDLPIVLVVICEVHDLQLVRQMLQAHTYWRRHGLMADLVILNEETCGYVKPLREQLEHQIQIYSAAMGVDRPGGIYLRNADIIPADDLTLLRTAASVVMIAVRGSLAQQMGVQSEFPDLAEPLVKKRDLRDPSLALPFMELAFFNSLGGFTEEGREYAIYLGPNIHTPAPWINVMANPIFGTLVSETGAGFTWYGNSQRNRLTAWSNDPVLDCPSEAIYIRDEESGAYWTPTAAPIREDSAYRARHGSGYTVFEHNSHGIGQELTVFIPLDHQEAKPVKLYRLILQNDTARLRKLSVTFYVEWTLGESREANQMHVVTAWDEEAQAILAKNNYQSDYPNRVAFAAISTPAKSYTADRTVFLGRNRSMKNPAALGRLNLSFRTGAGLDPCAAIQTTIKLAPGKKIEITCLLGQTQSSEQARALILTYRDASAVEHALRQTKAWWDDRLATIQVHTPELAVDFLMNRWLLVQVLSCRIWGRSAFYQSGGAFGFRDQLQDVLAMLYTDPKLARDHILLAASRQFIEGDVQHWWQPPQGVGIRSRISDDLLWLPYVVAHYLQVTADVSILSEAVPFLVAPPLKDDQSESFQLPEISIERATLFEHCRRAVKCSQKFGQQGLPLIGTGDWNDGLNRVGVKGAGESVWLAWFMVDVLRGMAEMCELLNESALSDGYRQERKSLIQVIEQHAWDGEWYRRATFDDGTLLGSAVNDEAKIDSLPQSWAWITGAADPKRAKQALESAWTRLVRQDEGLVLLFEPPFNDTEPSPGYIKGYPPGVRENGGQYTHAALWLAMAMARSGDGTRSAEILHMLNPIECAREPETVWRYGIEPYVAAADVYRLPGRIGAGGWSWYTGSAAWMYRTWLEEIFGFTLRGNVLQINPVIPSWWDSFQIIYRHGEAIYEIQIENPNHCENGISSIELDGQLLPGNQILLSGDLIKHRVLIRLGKSSK